MPVGRRLRTHARPVAWFAPVAGSAVAMVAWAGVAHSSGSGWVQAVGALLAAVLITGLLAPYVAARRATLTCTACPSDGQAGRPSALTMTANGPLRIRPRYPVGAETSAVGRSYGPRTVEVPITPSRRGVIESVFVEVASCAPFGLLWWARDVEVALPRPLHIAPRLGDPTRMESTTTRSAGDSRRRAPSGVGEPRGVRPYQPGDTRRSVHWPATSHVGTLMVREKEHQTDDPIVVDVVLPPDPPAAETEAERVMSGVTHALLRGRPWCSAPERPAATWSGWCATGSTWAGDWPGRSPPRAEVQPPPVGNDPSRRGPTGVTLWQRVVQANKPGPPEHSVSFRTASAASVIVAVAACWSQGELTATVAVLAAAATIIGNVLSYWRREQPWPPVKPILAVCAIGGFVWFIATVSQTATPGDISTVEAPLAVLFAWVLCTHAFDVPARRDVAYTLAGSAALMAVAAAQSVDLTLGIYVVLWVAFGVWGLVAMWQSMAGVGGVPWLSLGVAGVVVLAVAALLVALLPAPRVSTSLIFPSLSPNSSPVDSPSNLTDGSASLPAHAATSSSRIGVGGFLGFAKSLDTGVRAIPGQPGGDAGPGQPAQLLGRADLRHLERAELGGVDRPDHRAPPGQARLGIPVLHPAHRGPAGRPVQRRHRCPDLLPGPVGTQPGVPCRQRRNGSTSSRSPSTSPATAPSCRPPRWGQAPSTRWCPTTTWPPPHNCAPPPGGRQPARRRSHR